MGRFSAAATAASLALSLVGACGLDTPNQPAPTQPGWQFGRTLYGTDARAPALQAQRWPFQVFQADPDKISLFKNIKKANPAVELYPYSSIDAIGNSDPGGVVAIVTPAQAAQHPDWKLRDGKGAIIHRADNGGGGQDMLDPGNPQLQQAAAKFVLEKVRNSGANGAYFDEINSDPTFGKFSWPAKYPDEQSFAAAQVSFLNYVCGALHKAGLKCIGNVAGGLAFTKQVSAPLDGSETEYYIAKDPQITGGISAATLEKGGWQTDQDIASAQEQAGKLSYFHAWTTDPALVRYALGSYLLITRNHGVFGASQSYGSAHDPYTVDQQDARKLGNPTGNQFSDGGLFRRDFTGGTVTVNAHDTKQCAANGTSCLDPASATITAR